MERVYIRLYSFSFAEFMYSHGSNGEKPQKQRNLQTLFMSSAKEEPYNRAKIKARARNVHHY